jgi:copper chaperone CopZ
LAHRDFCAIKIKMMTQEYIITGMGCSGCVARVKQALLALRDIRLAEVQLHDPQAVITTSKPVSMELLQLTLHRVGHYTIRKIVH